METKRLEYFKIANYIAGTALILLGIFGFIPGITVDNMVFGIFMVDAVHNLVHMIVGLIMISAAIWTNRFTIYLIVLIGIAFLGLTAFGFFTPKGLGSFNLYDDFLHLVIAAFALFQGWLVGKVSE